MEYKRLINDKRYDSSTNSTGKSEKPSVQKVAITNDPSLVLPALDITPESIYQGIIYAEILGKPKSLRRK